jgi:hypothetical protein
MSLVDEIKKRLAGGGSPAPISAPINTENALFTNATGKAAPVGGSQASNIQATTAASLNKNAQDQLAVKGKIASEELGSQADSVTNELAKAKDDIAFKATSAQTAQNAQLQMEENKRMAQRDESMARLTAFETSNIKSISNKYKQQLNNMATEAGINTEDIWSKFKQDKAELAFRKDAVQLEQAAFNQRLSDDMYVEQLTRIGKLRDLNDRANFKKAALDTALGNKMDLLKDNENFRDAYTMNSVEWANKVSAIDAATALAVLDADMKSDNAKLVAEGVTKAGDKGSDWWNSPKNPNQNPDGSMKPKVETNGSAVTDSISNWWNNKSVSGDKTSNVDYGTNNVGDNA